jgi:hypothetical protein
MIWPESWTENKEKNPSDFYYNGEKMQKWLWILIGWVVSFIILNNKAV